MVPQARMAAWVAWVVPTRVEPSVAMLARLALGVQPVEALEHRLLVALGLQVAELEALQAAEAQGPQLAARPAAAAQVRRLEGQVGCRLAAGPVLRPVEAQELQAVEPLACRAVGALVLVGATPQSSA